MLEIKNITKVYVTEDLKQVALNKVSINFRKNEFVSILGPSGSGKTTLLNIIGGLDHYDKGDLIINEVSTKKYTDRDWDSYRNHRIGFVFQSYNLITHQSILKNVELALTLSGVSKTERVKRAKDALIKVGLKDHINKKPNQLSGGQMQRVAIARALVNNPDILLADEPTGALDSETSKQIMELLKEIAKDKLVIMVTHNPDLASEYSTRIIKLKDGKIVGDTDPYKEEVNTKEDEETEKLKSKKTSMNFMTAISLSLNNLMTKKGRTILTAFAGSIGIIGIALILSLSHGVRSYIDKMEKETLSSYPLFIEQNTMDFTSMMETTIEIEDVTCDEGKICTRDDITINPMLMMNNKKVSNNLKNFKLALDDNYKNIQDYVTDIQYVYNLDLQIYSEDYVKVNPNSLNLMGNMNNMSDNMTDNGVTIMTEMINNNVFKELIDNDELLEGQYDILSGRMPSKYNEVVLVVDENNSIPLSVVYSLDIENRENLAKLIEQMNSEEDVNVDSINYDIDSFVEKTYKLVLNSDYFEKKGNIWVDKSNDMDYVKELVDNGVTIEIVGILKISEDAVEATSGYVGYTHELTEYVLDNINKSEIAKEQINNPNINVFTNDTFDGVTNTYENNLSMIGINNVDSPIMINIYPKAYEDKDTIKTIIDEYNSEVSEEDKITYTDYVGVLMSSVTTIINVITYVLIGFVAISLVVSSIMIAIITYISVLERIKEIGILRAIGASKKDVSRVFNAENLIEGFVAGFMGILISLLLIVPINLIVKNLTGVPNIASLPVLGAIVLIVISVLLTLIAGLIPARLASKKDPVEALRSE